MPGDSRLLPRVPAVDEDSRPLPQVPSDDAVDEIGTGLDPTPPVVDVPTVVESPATADGSRGENVGNCPPTKTRSGRLIRTPARLMDYAP